MKVDDKVRIKVLDALFKGGLEPNYSKLAKLSGLDVKTVRNSIFFLENEGIIEEYIPHLNREKLGFGHNHINIVQFEFENEEEMKKTHENIIKTVPNMWWISGTDGPGLMNYVYMGIYKTNKERYDLIKNTREEMGLRKHLKNKLSIPLYGNVHFESPSKTVVRILKKEKGIIE